MIDLARLKKNILYISEYDYDMGPLTLCQVNYQKSRSGACRLVVCSALRTEKYGLYLVK